MQEDFSDTKLVVFVVDDDASMRRAVSNLIRSVGFRAEAFATAQEFLAVNPPDAPSCLILDVRLPQVSGLDIQTELIKTQKQLPIIFITGYGDIPMSVKAMKAGAVEFLTKPFRDQDLLDAVTIALDRSRLNRTNEKAAELGVSEITVKVHRGNVMKKFGVKSLADLVKMADTLGIRRTKS